MIFLEVTNFLPTSVSLGESCVPSATFKQKSSAGKISNSIGFKLKFPDLIKNKSILNEIKILVDNILLFNKDLTSCKTPKDEKLLKLQIDKTEEKINQLVYELYNLTDDEIDIIERELG